MASQPSNQSDWVTDIWDTINDAKKARTDGWVATSSAHTTSASTPQRPQTNAAAAARIPGQQQPRTTTLPTRPRPQATPRQLPRHPPMPYLGLESLSSISTVTGSVYSSASSVIRATSIPRSEVVEDGRYICDLSEYLNCRIRFQEDDKEAWVAHICAHMHRLPMTTICWFCGDHHFISVSEKYEDRREAFYRRCMHIAEHIDEDRGIREDLEERIRPDFFLLQHLIDTRVVGKEYEEIARLYREIPLPMGYKLGPLSKNARREAPPQVTKASGGGRHRPEKRK